MSEGVLVHVQYSGELFPGQAYTTSLLFSTVFSVADGVTSESVVIVSGVVVRFPNGRSLLPGEVSRHHKALLFTEVWTLVSQPCNVPVESALSLIVSHVGISRL